MRSEYLRLTSSVALALVCYAVLGGESVEQIPQCGKDVKNVSRGSAGFSPPPLCNERTSFTGTVSLNLVIGSDGRVESARIAASAITPTGSTPCAHDQAVKLANDMRFSAPSVRCRKSFPMTFKQPDRDLGAP